jgi:two-component sensor histidine kinase
MRFLIDSDDLDLDVAQAVPLGLILNVAVTNAIKYAFLGGKFGTISIILQQDNANGKCSLTMADNGVGLPSDFDEDSLNSLGMNLMKGLTEQLNGSFKLLNDNG